MFVGDLIKSILSVDAEALLSSRTVPILRILLLLTRHADRCASLWQRRPLSWVNLTSGDAQTLEGLWQVIRTAHSINPPSSSDHELISTGMTLLQELFHPTTTPDDNEHEQELSWTLLRTCMVGAVEVRLRAYHHLCNSPL